jgi:sugar phosphate permease
MTLAVAGDVARYRWVVLGVGTAAQASTAAFFQGLASIGPVIRQEGGLTLAELGVVLGAPMVGFVVTLVPWGVASDRFEERQVMAVGLTATALALAVASRMHGLWPLSVSLGLAGAAAASVNAASGRAVLRWFAGPRRGTAMGLRQTAIPLGAAAAAIVLPVVAERGGVHGALEVIVVGNLLAAAASWLWIREPPPFVPTDEVRALPSGRRPAALGGNRTLVVFLIVVSTGLVVCQSTFISFIVELLHARGMSLHAASIVFVAAQLCGGLGRVLVGAWSDAVSDRVRPLVYISAMMGAAQLLLAWAVSGATLVLVPIAVVAGALAIGWNGLVFTAVGEVAPPHRTGLALGAQSTANYLVASLTPFVMGSIIGATGFSTGYAVSGAAGGTVAVLLLVGLARRTASAKRSSPTAPQGKEAR